LFYPRVIKQIKMIKVFPKYGKVSMTILFVLVVIITFQTFQQVFYVDRFQPGKEIKFFDMLQYHSMKWLLWVILGALLFFSVKKDLGKERNIAFILKHFFIVVFLVLLNILIISFYYTFSFDKGFDYNSFKVNFFPFYLFQRAPLYTLGYIGFTVILFFYFETKELQIKVEELVKIKDYHRSEYEKLKKSHSETDQILQIKIGNKLKVIPIEGIFWIEANDYCVMIHTSEKLSYSMRISLKSLESKLPDHFMRVHRKGIVNMKKVKNFEANEQPTLQLSNDNKVPVSKGNIKKVKNYIYSL